MNGPRPLPERLQALRGQLIVSCQAWPDDPFHAPGEMTRFALAAAQGGAAGIRTDGAENVRDIVRATGLPVIGIVKRTADDGRILITPSFEDAAALAGAGAEAVAFDCTARGRRHGALDRVRRAREELQGVAVCADIATVEEALAAVEAGADLVLSTMRGYTGDTARFDFFDPSFIRELAARVPVPAIAEGRIWTREELRAAFEAGAFAAIVGSAVTRPRDITRRFTSAIADMRKAGEGWYAAVDLGGTNIKSALVRGDGTLSDCRVEATPAGGGRQAVLDAVGRAAAEAAKAGARRGVAVRAAGVAAAGWIDPRTGAVVYGTANLPDWTGAPVGEAVARATGLPAWVENDANALAAAEARFGAGRGAATFLCVTLGTGVGGGCWVEGKLRRGAHFMGNAIGHVTVEPGGLPCTCGRAGCLEVYANAAALLRYAGGRFTSALDAIAAARAGDAEAAGAVATLAGWLARGLAPAIHLLDPELIVLAGGLAQENPLLAPAVEKALARTIPLWERRGVAAAASTLGYHAGVLGAAAVAMSHY